jgi:FMN reductase
MSTRRLAVVTAGIGQPSSSRLLADRLAGVTVDALRERRIDADVTVIEARELAHELVDNLLTGFPSPRLRAAIDSVTGADGMIAVTPIFSASYSGLFKTFFDVLDMDALRGTPVALGATGGSERHSLALDHALRPLFAYLGAAPVPTGVFAATDDWGDPDAAAGLARRIRREGLQLAEAIDGRAPVEPRDPFADPVPFSRLLAGESGPDAGEPHAG